MSASPSNASLLNHIRRRAKAIKVSSRLIHARALDAAALESGFQNYRHAQRTLDDSTAPPPRPYAITLLAWWADRETRSRGIEKLTAYFSKPLEQIVTPSQWAHARYMGRFALNPSGELYRTQVSGSQDYARTTVCGVARELEFMCATGLRPSGGYKRALPNVRGRYADEDSIYARKPPGQDHPSVWFDPSTKRYLYAIEPYPSRAEGTVDRRAQWCEVHGYEEMVPSWPGMYAPHIEARLYLLSSREKGVPLGPIGQTLDALPSPVTVDQWPGETISLELPARAVITGGSVQKSKPRLKRGFDPSCGVALSELTL